MTRARGFTLIEVAIALVIFAISLSVLLEAQVSSLNNAGRARGMTIAALLARSKMIDAEQKLLDEGFTMGEVSEEGSFEEEGHPDYKWKYRLTEVEMDLTSLTSLCTAFEGDTGGSKKDEAGGGCDAMLSGLGAPLESLTSNIAKSIRLADLTVTWPDGKYTEKMNVRALLTREDFAFQPDNPFVSPLNPPPPPPPNK